MPLTPFEIPEQMRDAADKSVEQARKAFDDFIDATQKAVAKAENSAKTLREGAADVNRQALALVRARTVEEVTLIQQEFVQRQMQNLAEQGKNLGEMMGRTAAAVADKAKK